MPVRRGTRARQAGSSVVRLCGAVTRVPRLLATFLASCGLARPVAGVARKNRNLSNIVKRLKYAALFAVG